MKKVKKIVSFTCIIFLLLSGIFFGRQYYVKATLYKPINSSTSGKNRYIELHDKFGTKVTIYIPSTYKANKANKWIILAHGSNGSSEDMLNLPHENSLLKPLLDNGYIIVTPNYRNSTNWGNSQGIEDLVAAYELGIQKFSLDKKPYLVMQSMGGLVGLTSIAKGMIMPKAVVGIYPVTNLKFEYTNVKDSIPKLIKKSFNISNDKQFDKKTKGYNPIDYSGEKFKNIPMLFISSYEDKVVPRKQNTDEFTELVNKAGGNIKILTHKGNHGDKSAFKVSQIVDFLNKN